MEDPARPRTSTRDYDELHDRLTAWLAATVLCGDEPVVSSLEVPSSNGMSSETVLFDVEAGCGAERRTLPCAARLEPQPSAVPVFPSYDLAKQVHVMQLVRDRTAVPVPAPRWFEPDPAAVGAPFFVMERVDGSVPPDLPPYDFGSWLSEAPMDDQRRLQDATVEVLAALHELHAGGDLSFLESDRPGGTALRRHVADQWAYYRWVAGDRRQPLIERCFAWLDDHWPDDDRESVLSWGDARLGNVMYRDFVPVAVLDWEMAGVAPRGVDLGWLLFLHQFFEGIARQFGLAGMPHFLRREDVCATYERASGHSPRELEFYELYAATRHAIVMTRVTQRAIFFGEAEMPEDPDDLIMHRATLEAMLDGRYWAS